MTPDVIHVKTLSGFEIEAEFATGEVRRLDMTPYLDYPAFAPLKVRSVFETAHVAYGTVVWSDEIDLSPDTLYLRGVAVQA